QSRPTNQRICSLIDLPPGRFRAQPRHPSIPVLALEAQTFYWTLVAAFLPGHMSYSGARGTGGQWWLPADRPMSPVYRLATEQRKAYRVGKAAEAFRRWHGVYSALPTRLALGPIGGARPRGQGGPQVGALIETPGPPRPSYACLTLGGTHVEDHSN